MEPIKVFVGCAPNGEDAESLMVLEYSARKHCSMPIEFVYMKHSNDYKNFWSGWNSRNWATPFSGFRCGIPAYCNFKGQAIYMDSDMIVLSDLAELWNLPWTLDTALFQAKGRWRLCVSKINNERCKNHPLWPNLKAIKSDETLYTSIYGSLLSNPELCQLFDKSWNSFDGEDGEPLSDIKILHYTDMASQPHFKYALPRLKASGITHWYDGPITPHKRPDVEELFDTYYYEALKAGYTVEQFVPEKSQHVSYFKKSMKEWSYEVLSGMDR
jgi:hypothetical protein